MPITYFHQNADKNFWSNQWRKEDVSRLLQVANNSYLTKLIIDNLPSKGRILEAGCGLGQYVVLLRNYGYEIEGVDYSEQSINACKAFAPSCPVRVADVTKIDIPDGYYDSYISLGVVEHFQEGPSIILHEAHRVLSDGGMLLLSVPFANFLRRTFSWYMWAQNNLARIHEEEFYQYAFSKREIAKFLKQAGFDVEKFLPYDPGRIPKKALTKLLRKKIVKRSSINDDKAFINMQIEIGDKHKSFSRKLLYSRISLLILSHMILVVARKSDV